MFLVLDRDLKQVGAHGSFRCSLFVLGERDRLARIHQGQHFACPALLIGCHHRIASGDGIFHSIPIPQSMLGGPDTAHRSAARPLVLDVGDLHMKVEGCAVISWAWIGAAVYCHMQQQQQQQQRAGVWAGGQAGSLLEFMSTTDELICSGN